MISTSENADIFTSRDEIYLVCTKKSKFSFVFILIRELQKAEPNYFPFCFSRDLISSVCFFGLELHFNIKSALGQMSNATSTTPGQMVTPLVLKLTSQHE